MRPVRLCGRQKNEGYTKAVAGCREFAGGGGGKSFAGGGVGSRRRGRVIKMIH